MFTLLPFILMGVALVIAAPTPLDTATSLEARTKNNGKVSLYKNALPVGNQDSSFLIFGTPPIPSTVDNDASELSLSDAAYDSDDQVNLPLTDNVEDRRRALSNAGSGIPLTFDKEPLGDDDDDDDDEPFGIIGTDIGPLKDDMPGFKLKRSLPGNRGGSSKGQSQSANSEKYRPESNQGSNAGKSEAISGAFIVGPKVGGGP